MNAQQLKNSILQMAVSGKLVPQDPNDEPASVLLERIRKEKEQLIKEGKIKKEKNPSYIFRGADNTPYEKVGHNEPVSIADEVPFDIPDSWEWCRLGDIFYHNTGKALNASNQSGQLLEYITTSNLYWDRFELDSLRQMYFTDAEIEKCTATKGDLLVCEGGDIGRAAIWPYDYDIRIQNHIHRLRSYISVCTEFYYYLFYLYKHVGWIGGKGIGIQGLSANALHTLLFPLPPLEEQQRIVQKIKEIAPITEKYETAEKKLDTLNSNFPEKLKKSILQLAVQGKLVPQDSADEPASILLERIREEKERLIKEGKIKRDKNESVIYRRDNSHYEKRNGKEECIDDQVPFDIPDSWSWCRLRTICHDMRYGTAKKSLKSGKVAVLRMGNIQGGEIDYTNLVYSDDPEDNSALLLQDKDLLFNRTNSRELVGKTGIYRSKVPAIYAGYLVLIRPIIADPEYINYVMNSQYEWAYCQNVRSDGINQANVSASKIGEFLVPIPPLNEQFRIVQMLVKLLPLTNYQT